MGISVNIPDRMTEFIKEPYDNSVKELLIVELYREGRFTVRQAADMLGIGFGEMLELLMRRKSYLNYGREELNEDISYARS
jgi:predicted HTH domain antitoxin